LESNCTPVKTISAWKHLTLLQVLTSYQERLPGRG
jgi:hypothetical protein